MSIADYTAHNARTTTSRELRARQTADILLATHFRFEDLPMLAEDSAMRRAEAELLHFVATTGLSYNRRNPEESLQRARLAFKIRFEETSNV